MLVVGLTGGIGSGKSTVARLFQDFGICIIDADLLAREVVHPGSSALARIAEHFGPDIITADGNLDRTTLRRRVFNDPVAREWLEALLHPLIRERIVAAIAAASSPYCMLVSPLLLESDQRKLVDRVLVVDVTEAQQIERALARDGGERQTLEAIMATQLPREMRRQQADDILDNSGSPDQLAAKVKKLHESYLRAS